MFFYIGNHCELLEHVSHNIFVDNGWKQKASSFYKGYSTECNLDSSIDRIIDGYQPNGIWAVIHNNKLYHSELRGFPVYSNGNDITNIPNLSGFEFVKNNINWNYDFSTWDLDQVVSKATDIFLENILGFLKYNPDIKLTVLGTGGLDSALALAAINSITDYTLVRTTNKNKLKEYSSKLTEYLDSNHWAYSTINIQQDVVYNLVGFAAEAMTLRGYDMFNLICRNNDTTVYEMIHESDYMYHFLHRPEIKERLEKASTKAIDYKKDMLSFIDHDYYVWHIDNNFHVNPFYDKRIAETCMHLSDYDMIENCKTGLVERLMIEKIDGRFLSIVSDYKNHKPIFKNYDMNIDNLIDNKRQK